MSHSPSDIVYECWLDLVTGGEVCGVLVSAPGGVMVNDPVPDPVPAAALEVDSKVSKILGNPDLTDLTVDDATGTKPVDELLRKWHGLVLHGHLDAV